MTLLNSRISSSQSVSQTEAVSIARGGHLLFIVAQREDEGAVVGATLGQFAQEAHLNPVVSLGITNIQLGQLPIQSAQIMSV